MAYTKSQLVEQVFINVSGGKLSKDVNVKRIDIKFYFDAALNYALMKDYFTKRNMMIEEKRLFGFTDLQLGLNQQFLTTYEVTPISDTSRKLDYIELPAALLNLPGNRGIDSLFPSNDDSFVKVSGHSEVIGVPGVATYYWLERYPSGDRVYIKNLNSDCTLYLRMAVGIDGIGDNDTVPIPMGMEAEVINLMVEFFTRQRALPANFVNENTDVVNG